MIESEFKAKATLTLCDLPGGLDSKETTWNERDLGSKNPLEEEMAIHSSILAGRIPWIEESGRLQSMGSQTVRPDWVTKHSTLILYASSMFLANFYKIFKAKKAGPNVLWILSDRWGNTGSGLLTLNPPFSYFGQCTHCEKLTCLIHSSENRSLFPCFPYSLCHDYRNQDYFKYFFFLNEIANVC